MSGGQSPSGTALYLEESLPGEPALLEGTLASAELRPRGWEIGEIDHIYSVPISTPLNIGASSNRTILSLAYYGTALLPVR